MQRWRELRGRPIGYGRAGVPTPRVWATRKTLHQLHRAEGQIKCEEPFLVRDMARHSASALFRSSLAAGTPASIPMCVRQINDEFRGLHCTLKVKNARNYSCMDAAVPCTLGEPSRTYVYFQQMKADHHSLTLTNDATCRGHLPKRDLEKMKCELSVLGGSRYAYAKTDLAITPHGSELTAEKMVVDCYN